MRVYLRGNISVAKLHSAAAFSAAGREIAFDCWAVYLCASCNRVNSVSTLTGYSRHASLRCQVYRPLSVRCRNLTAYLLDRL